MASPVFQPFSRLLIELRLQIWEDACLPSSKHHRGLHYMGVNVNKRDNIGRIVFLGSAFASLPEKRDSISQSNRSAYLWDTGLWTACKESREVVIRHSHINGWPKVQRICENGLKYLCDEYRGWDGREEAVLPRALARDAKWHRIVYPEQDMFCISKSVWESLPWKLTDMAMYFPFVGNKKVVRFLYAHNLALEYDPSWNLNWNSDRHDLWHLREELSPRSFLAHMLANVAGDMGFAPILKLWLIDKGTKWVARAGQNLGTVYYDCDAEYVEVDWQDTRSDTRNSASPSAVTTFIKKLGVSCDAQYRKDFCYSLTPHPCGICWCCCHYSAETSIRLLVRRDNEVKELTDDGDCI